MKILYRLVPHNQGAVFAFEDRAHAIARINEALRTSTWGEFAAAIGKEELEEIHTIYEDMDEPWPEPEEAFNPECVPGFDEGDYPPWLQPEMGRVVPMIILETFGNRVSTSLNGDYWHIGEDQMEAMAAALTERGFVVERADDLAFH